MKILTAAFLTVCLSVAILVPAAAKHGHESGPDVSTATSAGSDRPHVGAAVPSEGFSKRGKGVTPTLTADPDKPHTGAEVPSKSFSKRGADVEPPLATDPDKPHAGAEVPSRGFKGQN